MEIIVKIIIFRLLTVNIVLLIKKYFSYAEPFELSLISSVFSENFECDSLPQNGRQSLGNLLLTYLYQSGPCMPQWNLQRLSVLRMRQQLLLF